MLNIKPKSSLIKAFADVIGWECGVKLVFVLKRIVLLSDRHTARLKPAIQNFFDSTISLAVFYKSHIVDKRSVQIVEFGVISGQRKQLFDTFNNNIVIFVLFVDPNWHRRTPISIATNRPITSAF